MAYFVDGTVRDIDGVPVSDALVYVYAPDGTLASLYDSLSLPLLNPVQTNNAGYWSANATDDGYYTVRINYGGRERKVYEVLLGTEPIAKADGIATALTTYTFGYIGIDTAAPPSDITVGDGYVYTTDARVFGAVKDSPTTGENKFEILTVAALATVNGASIGYTAGVSYPANTFGRALNGVVAAPVTDKFIRNLDSAVINRLGDRVFIGGANKQSGNYPNNNAADQDWYTTYERAQGRSDGIMVSSQFGCLTNNYAGAAVAGTFAARTSNLGPTVGGAVGLEAHVVNDNATVAHDAWALYSEATRDSEGVGAIITYEADARNKGSYHPVTPSNQHPKQSVVHQVASGGALTGVGCDDVSAGINFRHNPTKFGVGIVFGQNSIRGTDGTADYGNAILAGIRHQFAWMNPADEITGFVRTTTTAGSNKSGVEFSDSGILFLGATENTVARFRQVGGAVNYIDVIPGGVSGAVTVSVGGSDANISLYLQAKGTGTIDMSPDAVRNYASDSAAAAGGVPIGGLYHSAGDLKIRIT